MTRERKIWFIITAILVVVIFRLRECGGKGKPCPIPKKTSDTIREVKYDSTTYYVYDTVYRPRIVYRDIPANVDTAAIMMDYFAIKMDSDTIKQDSNFVVVINDTLTQNGRLARGFSHKNLRATNITNVINTVTYDTCPKPSAKIFVGGFLVGNESEFGAGPSVTFITRKDHMYTAGYDAVNKRYQIGTSFKISLRKKK